MHDLPLLAVNDPGSRFHTPERTVYAENGVSFTLHEGETLAVVGESGWGKSVSMMSMLGLIPIPPGEIAGGTAMYRTCPPLGSGQSVHRRPLSGPPGSARYRG